MRQNKQKREKHELIFKYVRALTPYEENPEAPRLLQQLSSRKDTPTPTSILATSRTGDSPTKSSKKRVQFSDDVVMHSTPGKFNSQKASPEITEFQEKNEPSPRKKEKMNTDQRTKQRETPENIHKDLEALQRSVFSTFQIKEPKPTLINSSPPLYSLTARNTYSHSTYTLPIHTPISYAPPEATRSPNLVSRAKSAATMPTKQQLQFKDKKTISSSIQTSRQTIKPSRPQSMIRSVNSRALSQQQANLMVQIFKQRLQMQGGR